MKFFLGFELIGSKLSLRKTCCSQGSKEDRSRKHFDIGRYLTIDISSSLSISRIYEVFPPSWTDSKLFSRIAGGSFSFPSISWISQLSSVEQNQSCRREKYIILKDRSRIHVDIGRYLTIDISPSFPSINRICEVFSQIQSCHCERHYSQGSKEDRSRRFLNSSISIDQRDYLFARTFRNANRDTKWSWRERERGMVDSEAK